MVYCYGSDGSDKVVYCAGLRKGEDLFLIVVYLSNLRVELTTEVYIFEDWGLWMICYAWDSRIWIVGYSGSVYDIIELTFESSLIICWLIC